MEAKRILGSRLFIAVLAGLVVLSCFFHLYQRPDTWENPLVDGEVYHEQLENLKNMSWEDAHAWCVQYQEDAEAARFVGTWDYDSEAEEIRIAAAQLQSQYEHLMGYQPYLKKIQAHAKLLQSVSLFSDPNSIGYKNTVKTAKDFEKMLGVEVTAGHDLAVTEFFTDKWTDYSIIIVICVVCGLHRSAVCGLLDRRSGAGGIPCFAVRHRIPRPWGMGTVAAIYSHVQQCTDTYDNRTVLAVLHIRKGHRRILDRTGAVVRFVLYFQPGLGPQRGGPVGGSGICLHGHSLQLHVCGTALC